MRKPEQRYDLTPRESIVADLMRRGFSVAMIAFTLGVSRSRAYNLRDQVRHKELMQRKQEEAL